MFHTNDEIMKDGLKILLNSVGEYQPSEHDITAEVTTSEY